MNVLKIVLKVIRRKLICCSIYVRGLFYIMCFKRENVIFLLGTPLHGNLGDQAIAFAEEQLIKKNVDNKKIIEIPSQFVNLYMSGWKRIIGNSLILIHGGGFFGSLWPEEDMMLREILMNFQNNNIIILPQTIFFENDSDEEIKQYKNILEQNSKILIYVREKYSFNLAVNEYKFPNVHLMPDMVTYLTKKDFFNSKIEKEGKAKKILFCLRKDREKVIKKSDEDFIKRILPGNNFEYTDTVVNGSIHPKDRQKMIGSKIHQFMNAKLVITDRLHGMVFAAIAGTPCIVLRSQSYKVKGVYEWINANPYIQLANSKEEFEDVFNKMNFDKKYRYDNTSLVGLFHLLGDTIGGKYE